MKAELRGNPPPISLQNRSLFNTPQNSLSGALRGCLGSLDGACIEKLLLHCASALESNDVTLAQQVMWVLNNVASSMGDPNQRLASWFLRALISRASRVCPTTAMNFSGSSGLQRRLMTVTELAEYVDLIPWHRFGFCAANSTIFNAIQGCPRVHILDFSITHCMQWPTLIDALAKRPEGPPSLRITVPSFRPPDSSSSTMGEMISRESSSLYSESLLNHLNPSMLDLRDDEALVVNCQNWLRYLPDDQKGRAQNVSLRDTFLETFLPKDNHQRIEYEADIGHKIEDIITYEGLQRIERLESGPKLSQRMKSSGFLSIPFCEETVREVKFLLDEHASGWGMKREEDMLVLTWKGHNSIFATAWFPSGLED
ncbi:Scarecrow-like protein 32 [Vitis vinifera]|uniref:Scarecrow-like protein 32 n=1 Tax=Vitis vinifera TaxID=29760 RepID=A0A438GJV7_VITVI|nr:Scarecrow-like protein 32 [Vitis vinifera]